MTNKKHYYCLLFLVFISQTASADTVKILEWNISGNELLGNTTNQNAATAIFDSENADVIALQETSRGSNEIAAILSPDYTQVIAIDGQEIWIRNGSRFVIESTGTWAGLCNNNSLDGAFASIRDLNSNSSLHLYSAHFCIPDTFAGGVDTNPNVSNEDQQEHLCNVIDSMEANAATGTVVMAADFNDINIPVGESLVSFLQSTGTLNGGFCIDSAINMVDVVSTDVTHIMGTGGAGLYSSIATGNPSFGQHGYVVASVELDGSETDPETNTGATAATDGGPSTAVIKGRVSLLANGDGVITVLDTDKVAITGTIEPAQEHIGQVGNLYIIVFYQEQVFFRNDSGGFSSWNGELGALGPYREDIILEASMEVEVITGQLLGLFGSLEIHFAYFYQSVFYFNVSPLSIEIIS